MLSNGGVLNNSSFFVLPARCCHLCTSDTCVSGNIIEDLANDAAMNIGNSSVNTIVIIG
jgi:hypothetical protein